MALGRLRAKRPPAPFVLLNRRAGAGSRNLVREAAMTGDQCERALLAGAFLARDLKQMGYGILASGEMGIGNTTPAQRPGLGPYGSLSQAGHRTGGRSLGSGPFKKAEGCGGGLRAVFPAVSQV